MFIDTSAVAYNMNFELFKPMTPGFGNVYITYVEKRDFTIQIKGEDVLIPIQKEVQQPPKDPNPIALPTPILTTGLATLAVVFKYFNTVDLLMNFFSKINVDMGQRLRG